MIFGLIVSIFGILYLYFFKFIKIKTNINKISGICFIIYGVIVIGLDILQKYYGFSINFLSELIVGLGSMCIILSLTEIHYKNICRTPVEAEYLYSKSRYIRNGRIVLFQPVFTFEYYGERYEAMSIDCHKKLKYKAKQIYEIYICENDPKIICTDKKSKSKKYIAVIFGIIMCLVGIFMFK